MKKTFHKISDLKIRLPKVTTVADIKKELEKLPDDMPFEIDFFGHPFSADKVLQYHKYHEAHQKLLRECTYDFENARMCDQIIDKPLLGEL
jgi:hypothetical protein